MSAHKGDLICIDVIQTVDVYWFLKEQVNTGFYVWLLYVY